MAVAEPADEPGDGEEEEQARPFVDVLDLEDMMYLSEDPSLDVVRN